ncbi:MAG: hypothetical protein E7082_07485 [Bacteroidales bacterium]|nr:hypothetical protein [Bacteroidales bacterium]
MEKKPIITLLILGTIIATTSCNKADRDRDYETLWGLNRPAKSFTVRTYEATSKFGEPTKGDLEEVYTVYFNEDGNTESIKKYDPNGDLKEVAKFKYDENGLRTKHNLYDSDGDLNMTIKYEYEGDKVCKMSIQSDYLNQEVISKWEGDCLKETETYTDGEFSGSTEYTKQSKTEAQWTDYDANGGELWEGSTTHNDDGRIIEYRRGEAYYEAKWNKNLPIYLKNAHLEMNTWITLWDSDEDIEYFIEYEYDSKGNWIKQTVFETEELNPIYISEREINY